ncbi:MAG: ATP-binding protein [Cyanobacteria bacterium J06621_15]
MAASLINPYIVGNPIGNKEKFFGRDDVFYFIEDNLAQGTSVIFLHGQRRIGKTSVLAQIPNFLSHLNQFVFVRLSLEGQNQGNLSDILNHLAIGIIESLNLTQQNIIIPKKLDLEANSQIFINDFLPQIFKALGEKKIVLLLDEFDAVIDRKEHTIANDFFRYLQSMLKRYEGIISLIPVIGRQLYAEKILVSLFRQAPLMEVGLLDNTNTKRLITKTSEGILKYEPEAIQSIWELSSGQPYCTQLLCSVVFEKARDKQEEEVENWQIVTKEDVNRSIDEAITKGENGLAWFRLGLPPAERVVFAAIAEMQERSRPEHWKLLEDFGVTVTDELYQALETLENDGFIQKREPSQWSREQPYPHAIMVELVRCWFIKKQHLREEILELDKLHPETIPLYEQAEELCQEKDFREAITLYEQVLQTNPNHFKALFSLASACLQNEQYSRAVELYARVCKVDNLSVRFQESFVTSLVGYGRDLMLQSNLQQAKVQFATALELEPDNKRAQQRLLEVETQLEKERTQISVSLQNVRNPFSAGIPVPPENFVGRRSAIASAFDQIYNRSHLSIHGSTGIGKSSFLRYLASPEVWEQFGLDSNEAIIVYLNCDSIFPFTPDAFWREVLTLLKEELSNEKLLQTDIKEILTVEALTSKHVSQILRKIGKQNRFLLLLLDNYEAALFPHENYTEADIQTFVSNIRNLASHSFESQYLSTVVASSKRLNEIGPQLNPSASPWYNHYLFLSLKPFNDIEVSELLSRMPSELKLTTTLRQGIQEISGGIPVLVQNACFLIYNIWRSGQTLTVETFAEEFLRATVQIFQDWWTSFNETQQILLMLIALSQVEGHLSKSRQYDLSDIDIIFAQKKRELRDLEYGGFIKLVESSDKMVYQFTSSMMEWWVLTEIKNSGEEVINTRRKVFLSLMSHKQMQQIQNGIRWLQSNQDAVPSILTLKFPFDEK